MKGLFLPLYKQEKEIKYMKKQKNFEIYSTFLKMRSCVQIVLTICTIGLS